jgi:EAL domain-containing protein (putative c-di-GMP-specific phosphodiesterase class I)
VNVSVHQLRDSRLVEDVRDALTAARLPGESLVLEITEGVLLNDERANLATLTELQRLGVRIAIDDFGTGYASLAYLKRFAFDKIKIDQSFVREITKNADSDAIVRAVVDLGRMLGMSTIAEGVETAEELERVRAHGCGAVQGYLTGRPMALPDARALLASQAAGISRRA